MKLFRLLLTIIVLFTLSINAKEISTNNWLYLGNINTIFSDNESTLKPSYLDLSKIIPIKGSNLTINGNSFTWFDNPDNIKISNCLFYAGTYFTNTNFANIKFSLNTNLPFEFYIDGKLQKSEYNPKKENQVPFEFSVNLETGKHTIVLKSLYTNNNPSFILTAKTDSLNKNCDINFSHDPQRYVTFSDLLDNPKVKSVSVSPNGKFALLSISERNKSKNGNETYFRLFDIKDKKELIAFRSILDLSSFQFSDDDYIAAYTKSDKNGTNLYIANLKTGTANILLSEIKDFGDFTWSPDGKFIVYTIKKDKPTNTTGLKKYDNMSDRYPWSSSYYLLHFVDVSSGFTYQLTKGTESTDLNSISSDGKYLIYSVTKFISNKRPYSQTNYFLLDINKLTSDSLFTMYWGGTATFSPEGDKIAVTGGPTEFNNLGLNIPEGMIANDYDTQLYLYDIKTKQVKACSKDFNPSISAIYYTDKNTIFVNTTDKNVEHVYKYEINQNRYTLLNLGAETIGAIDFDNKGAVAVYYGATVNTPGVVKIFDIANQKSELLFEPEGEQYKNIKLGKVEDFSFKATNGKTIEGFVHYPVDYDPNKKYPCIVYYYGGTTPVEKEFEGRYPKNIWAANGYFVYVLEPSGCTGYGQEFSAYHVNDWGTITAEEIIEGTKALLNEYKAIDSKSLGCIGASYGGFMTLNLIIKTNIFSAAVSHAGISALSSYWGNGYWGYTYSAVATANSFPWNRKDIYVNNSSLFNADKITTPLLLLHGNSDTNVPPGESMQMYTALKLLGKDVELIEVDGQDHHILEYDKRIIWSKTILAYFDKYLKKDSSWWKFLYK